MVPVLALTFRAVDPDPHSFSLLDPDPEGKIFHMKTEKVQGNWK